MTFSFLVQQMQEVLATMEIEAADAAMAELLAEPGGTTKDESAKGKAKKGKTKAKKKNKKVPS